MSETTSPMSQETATVLARIVETIDAQAQAHDKTADARRDPDPYRSLSTQEDAEAAAYEAISDAFSSLAHALRAEFDLPDTWGVRPSEKN